MSTTRRPDPSSPRPLSHGELETLLRVGDVLIPDNGILPSPRLAPDYETWLERALAARSDAFERIVATLAILGGLADEVLHTALRELGQTGDSGLAELSVVIAGAYLMIPEIRDALGYPGQRAQPARFDEAAEQITNGILDPVIERGQVFREAHPDGAPLVHEP